jgi:hypothetical protein
LMGAMDAMGDLVRFGQTGLVIESNVLPKAIRTQNLITFH